MLHDRGFSLIELLFVLMLMGILIATSMPLMMKIYQHIQARVACDQLVHAMKLARNEAVAKHVTVMLCKSKDQQTCSGEWINGYIILANQKILYVFKNPNLNGKINWRAFPLNKDNLQFLSTGFSKTENGTFWYCGADAEHPAWAIVMNQSGRIRVVFPDPHNEILDDNNAPLKCSTYT